MVRKHFTTVALLVGFVVDLVTFRNLNLDLTQIILLAHLVIVAGSILIFQSSLFTRFRAWLLIANQYSTGSLLSAFLVLYSASGSLVASFPFLALLVLAVLGNETVRLEQYRLSFQTTLFFLNLMLFMAFAVPLMVGSIGTVQFFISTWAALALFIVFLWAGRLVARSVFKEHRVRIRAGWVSVFVLMMALYFLNLIPPIPLSLKAAGFYHSVARLPAQAGVGDAFIVEDEARGPLERFFDFNGVTLHLAPGEPAYVFTAVFAPAKLDASVLHRWEYRDPDSGEWVTRQSVPFSITGGRPDGYRLYSQIGSPVPGRYRVSVETTSGAVIGRLYLTVAGAPSPVPRISTALP